MIRNRLNRLKDRQEFNNDNKNNNNNLLPPPSPPSSGSFFSQQPPPQAPPPTIPRQQLFLPPPTTFSPFQPPPSPTFSPFQPPPPLPPPSPPPLNFPSFQQNFSRQGQFLTQPTFPPRDNPFGSQTQTLTREKKEETRDKILDEIDDKIFDIPNLSPKLELGDGLAKVLGKEVEDILKEEFVNLKELEDKTLENIEDEYNFDEIKGAFDDASVPKQLEFFYGGNNNNFIQACNFLSHNEDNNEFISFLCSDDGQNITTNNSLFIHIESRNIFYQNSNTNENFYSFLLTQQDETKAIIAKRIAYYYSFEKYIKNYLPFSSVDDIEKFDLYTDKNSKYLLYKFNDWIESFQAAEKLIIWHAAKAKDSVNLRTIEEEDTQFLIEKIIHGIEFNDPYNISSKKKPEIIDTVEKNYRISRRVYQSLFVNITDSFIEYIHSLNVDEIQQLDDDLKANGSGQNLYLKLKMSMSY